MNNTLAIILLVILTLILVLLLRVFIPAVTNYLKNLPEIKMKKHEEYEKDLPIYEKVSEAGNLQSVHYFTDYLKTIRNGTFICGAWLLRPVR